MSNIELLERGVNKQEENWRQYGTFESERRQKYIEMLKGKIEFLKGRLDKSDEEILLLDDKSEDWHEESDRYNKNHNEYDRTQIICALLEYLDRLEEQENKDFIPNHTDIGALRHSLEERLCYQVPLSTFDNELKESIGTPCKYKDIYNYKKILDTTIKYYKILGLKTREDEEKEYGLIEFPQDPNRESFVSNMDKRLLASKNVGGKRRKTKKQKKLKKKTKRAVKSNKRRKTRRT